MQLQENFLRGILSIRHIAEQPVGEAEHLLLMRSNQRLERIEIAGPGHPQPRVIGLHELERAPEIQCGLISRHFIIYYGTSVQSV